MNEFKDLLVLHVYLYTFAFAIFIALFSDSDRLHVSSAAEPKQRVKGLVHGHAAFVFCSARCHVNISPDSGAISN